MVTCPDCDAKIDLDEEELDEGDLITCDECGAELRVLGLDPVELEPTEDAEEEEEDLDADEEDDPAPWR
jgi:alpha-aminoadipate carrier protein LysW